MSRYCVYLYMSELTGNGKMEYVAGSGEIVLSCKNNYKHLYTDIELYWRYRTKIFVMII
jgi:hypothetical protein